MPRGPIGYIVLGKSPLSGGWTPMRAYHGLDGLFFAQQGVTRFSGDVTMFEKREEAQIKIEQQEARDKEKGCDDREYEIRRLRAEQKS